MVLAKKFEGDFHGRTLRTPGSLGKKSTEELNRPFLRKTNKKRTVFSIPHSKKMGI